MKDQPLHLVVYAFSTQEEVLTQGIFPAFEKAWEGETGKDVVIEGVFGPSGAIAGQIALGAPADIAIFSNQRCVDWLKLSKCVKEDTMEVLISSSPLVILTRQGNPKDIADYKDLAKPGLQLLHADPDNSGVGEWSLLAEYGSYYLESGDQGFAESQLEGIWRNVTLVGSSARVSLYLFEIGIGDALITYEQDALLAQERGVPMDIILPARTILTRHYALTIDKNITYLERTLVEDFLDYIQGDDGQQILSNYYFRSIIPENDYLPALVKPFTEDDLGGWVQAYETIIENYWNDEIKLELELKPASIYLVGK